MTLETSPQDTAANLGFETSDEELRRMLNFSMKVSTGHSQMSAAIVDVLKEFDVNVTDEVKRAAGIAFLFTYGLARSAALAEVKAEYGIK